MNIEIQDKGYRFVCDYKENEVLRKSFNELTNSIWEFDFEAWYQSGYWGDSCHLYSLMDGDKMVSHITVSVFDCVILGEKRTLAQLGTVMTDEAYRGRDLNRFLMDKILDEWSDKCDFTFLFANESVLDFYPKFGFSAVNEFQAVKMNFEAAKTSFRKLDIDNVADLNLLDRIGRSAMPLFDLSVVNNIGTIMFYCKALGIFKDNLFYFTELDAIAVAEYDEENLIVHDILASQQIDIDLVIDSLIKIDTKNVCLRFVPQDSSGYELKSFKDEDLVLFVSSKAKALFDNNKLIFQTLAHT